MVTALTLPDLDTLDQDALKVLVLAQHERLLSREHESEHLKLLIPKSEHLPRETHKHDPQRQTCPNCGGALHQFGEASVVTSKPAMCERVKTGHVN